jgi:hypothetical protein
LPPPAQHEVERVTTAKPPLRLGCFTRLLDQADPAEAVGTLENAQATAAHESPPRTTKLYDRTNERLMQDEVERIRL